MISDERTTEDSVFVQGERKKGKIEGREAK